MFATVALAVPAALIAQQPGANLQRPRFSASGEKLAWEANYHDEKRVELHVGPLRGPFAPVRLPTRSAGALAGFDTRASSAGRVIHEIAWGPVAGDVYVFSASTEAADYDLFVSEGAPLAVAPGADGGAAWSPDGRWIAFTSARTGQGDLYLLDVQAIERPPRRLTKDDTHAELFATWSPEADRLAYVGHAPTGDHLWLISLRDGVPVRLTEGHGSQLHPRFSPNGALVAYYANGDRPDRFDLYVVEARQGASPRRLAEGVVVDSLGPSFTPDGRHLVFVADDDGAYDPVKAVPVGGGLVRTVSLGTVGHGDLDLSRGADGRTWIAVVAQGLEADAVRDWKRLYLAELPAL